MFSLIFKMFVCKAVAAFLSLLLASYPNFITGSNYTNYPQFGEGRQLNEAQSATSFRAYDFKPSVKSGKIKMKMMESQNHPFMFQDSNEDRPNYEPQIAYGYNNHFQPHPRPMYSGGIMSYIMEEDEKLGPKEAALKGFGVGLALGLGALGSVVSLVKWLLIPLLGLLLSIPLLLLLLSPVPVIMNGKMFKSLDQKRGRLQETIDEITNRVKELEGKPPIPKKEK